MQLSEARGREPSLPVAFWLSGAVGLLASGLTVALVWAVFREPATVIEVVRLLLGAR